MAIGCAVVVTIVDEKEGEEEGGEEEGGIEVAADERLGLIGIRRYEDGGRGQ